MRNGNDYRPAPFWFLNERLEKEELRRQIELMKKAGVSGFFMHPRAGLKTPYGSEEWFEIINYIAKEAKKAGLKAWLYDEDPFPSGIAGGKVIFDHPEFIAKAIKCRKFFPDSKGRISEKIGTGRILSVIAIRKDKKGSIKEILDLKENVGILRDKFFRTEWNSPYYAGIVGKEQYFHYRAETFYPGYVLECILKGANWTVSVISAEIVREGGKFGFRPDNLNPESVHYFIECTHENYKKYCGRYFGKAIPGIFTDEPAAGGILPYTGNLEKIFLSEKKYDLKKSYFHLFNTFSEESHKVRQDYWGIVNKIYTESYFAQIYRWCRKNKIETTGHVICEEDPIGQVYTGGNVFPYQKYCDIPGFDIVTTNIGNSKYPSLNFGGKLISSAAHQQGKKRILSECFACAPWNYEIEGMLKTSNWLFALGITWLVPHGFFYSINGFRKDDAGKAYSFQDPHYKSFEKFASYANRAGELLANCVHQTRTVVLYQISNFWRLIPAQHKEAEGLRDRLYSIMQKLIEEHIEFDFVDEGTLLKSRINNGEVICGKETYSSIIIPFPEHIRDDVRKFLGRFQRNKGIVIRVKEENFIEMIRKSDAIFTDIEPSDKKSSSRNLMVLRKKANQGEIVYIFNNSSSPGFFKLKNELADFGYVYNAHNGLHYSVDTGRDIPFGIKGFESLIFVFTDKKIKSRHKYFCPQKLKEKKFEFEEKPQWNYYPPQRITCAIEKWNLKIKGKNFEKVFRGRKFCLLRDVLGTELNYLKEREPRPGFDTAQPITSIYPVDVEFVSEFEIENISPGKKNLLVFETETISGDGRIFINGLEIDRGLIKKQFVYDPYNLVVDLKKIIRKGTNSIKIKFENGAEFDGLRSLFYVI